MEDDKTEKINELARSLKENNLAASMDEAVEKASQIIEGVEKYDIANKKYNEENISVKSMEDVLENEKKDTSEARESAKEAEKLKEEIEKEEDEYKEEMNEIIDIDKEIQRKEKKAKEIMETDVYDEEDSKTGEE